MDLRSDKMSSQKLSKSQVIKKSPSQKVAWSNTVSADDDSISIHSSAEDSMIMEEEEIEEYVRSAIQSWLDIHGHSLFSYEMSKFLRKEAAEKKKKIP